MSICFRPDVVRLIIFHLMTLTETRDAQVVAHVLDALLLVGEFSFHLRLSISCALLSNSRILTSLTMYHPKALIIALLFTLSLILAAKSAEQLQIGVKYVPEECPVKSRKGDRLSMQ